MGALDPHHHKRNQLTLQAPYGESGRTTSVESGTLTRSMEDLPVDNWHSGGLFTTSEEYYPTVISASLSTAYDALYHKTTLVHIIDSLLSFRVPSAKLLRITCLFNWWLKSGKWLNTKVCVWAVYLSSGCFDSWIEMRSDWCRWQLMLWCESSVTLLYQVIIWRLWAHWHIFSR